MNSVLQIGVIEFIAIYGVLFLTLGLMKFFCFTQSALLFYASLKMGVQLAIAGAILAYVLDNQHPFIVLLYLLVMVIFVLYIVLSRQKDFSVRFKVIVGVCITLSCFGIILIFLYGIINTNLLNAQYSIPLAGMILGNVMSGVKLGLQNFSLQLSTQRAQVEALNNLGVPPHKILLPFINKALESAILPTANSMLGTGIVFLPGMMSGQILSGIAPITAVVYQITIMVAISSATCLACFSALHLSSKTLYNQNNQFKFL